MLSSTKTFIAGSADDPRAECKEVIARCFTCQPGIRLVHFSAPCWVDDSGGIHTGHTIEIAAIPQQDPHPEVGPSRVEVRVTDVGYYYSVDGKETDLCTVEDEQDPNFDVAIGKLLGVSVNELLVARLRDVARPSTFQECGEVLGSTIRYDLANKLILFSAGLLTFTSEDQFNILMSGESAGGKSYTVLEVASYFPEDVLLIMASASPKAFFHDHGVWDNERKLLVVDLRGKIIIFLDQPHYMLMEALRALLSHDRHELLYKITDKNKRGQNQTKNVVLIGYPTVIFCAAKFNPDEQEKTRVFMLSPETSQQKLQETITLKIARDSDRKTFKDKIASHPRRKWLKSRIQAIRSEGITEVIIPSQEEINQRFLQSHQRLAPRHQRDISRILALIKAHALLNLWHRERQAPNTIVANHEDVEAGFWLYSLVAKANELGLAPQIFEMWENVINPLLNEIPTGVKRREMLAKYHDFTGRFMSESKLRKEILPAIEAAGLAIQIPDPDDKREKLVMRPVTTSHSETKGNTSGGSPQQLRLGTLDAIGLTVSPT